MFSLNSYYIFYLFLCYITFILEISKGTVFTKFKDSNYKIFIWIIIGFLGLIFGLRDINFGTDTYKYLNFIKFPIDITSFIIYDDIGIFILIKYLKLFFSSNITSIIISILSVYLYISSYRKIIGDNSIYFIPLILSFFWFIDLNSNLLKAGLAYGFILCALAHSKRKNILFTIAFLFHSSSIIFFVAYRIRNFIRTKTLLLLWFICNIFSYFEFGLYNAILYLINYINPNLADILNIKNILLSESYKTGFRIDFSIYSFLAIAPFILKIFKGKNFDLLNLYIILNSLFVLSYNVPYSNRLGLLSFILMPIILYQSFDQNNYKRQFYFPIYILVSSIFTYLIL
ncbi:EpsG family protein [Polaribacter tangerinus]|uniref:EpsG family protein n=1 Tax=Polaribacter tangerinus TaxID=1920034 RepID=UPI000B4AFD0D|nr:EpsG family protein [Polaribacter tangerinus]